ncbi:hypothetical protein AMTRI_Chr07g75550 [Amborella trichopoda]
MAIVKFASSKFRFPIKWGTASSRRGIKVEIIMISTLFCVGTWLVCSPPPFLFFSLLSSSKPLSYSLSSLLPPSLPHLSLVQTLTKFTPSTNC